MLAARSWNNIPAFFTLALYRYYAEQRQEARKSYHLASCFFMLLQSFGKIRAHKSFLSPSSLASSRGPFPEPHLGGHFILLALPKGVAVTFPASCLYLPASSSLVVYGRELLIIIVCVDLHLRDSHRFCLVNDLLLECLLLCGSRSSIFRRFLLGLL